MWIDCALQDLGPSWSDKDIKELESNTKLFECSEGKPIESVITRTRIHATIKHFITHSIGRKCISVATSQVLAGTDTVTRNKCLTSPLHAVAKSGHLGILRVLLDDHADVNSRDKNGLTPLDVAENQLCKDELKRMGAGGWTPLMIAVDHGVKSVEQYMNYREVFACVRNRSPFPCWFIEAVQVFWKDMDWTWGPHESSSINLSEDLLRASKVYNSPDYSCALGSLAFEKGIHRWAIALDNVQSMWLGIARGVEEQGGLGSSPGNEGEYMLVFASSAGHTTLGDKEPIMEVMSNDGFKSCQLVQFEMDFEEQTLKMSVDGVQMMSAKNVDVQGVRPYVCMDYEESATIVSRSVAITDSEDGIDSGDRKDGLDNALWTEAADSLVMKIFASGKFNLPLYCWKGSI